MESVAREIKVRPTASSARRIGVATAVAALTGVELGLTGVNVDRRRTPAGVRRRLVIGDRGWRLTSPIAFRRIDYSRFPRRPRGCGRRARKRPLRRRRSSSRR